MSAPRTQLDSRVQIVTPENIAFEYRVAGPFARIGAYLLDLIIIAVGILLFSILVGIATSYLNLPGLGGFAIQVMMFLTFWFYAGLFEWLWNGQTPGKRMTGLRVLRTDGRPITAGQSILRNLLKFIDLYPYVVFNESFGEDTYLFLPTCLVGLTAMACSPRYQRVGDLACGTMVVAEEPSGSGRAAKDWTAASETARDPQLQQVMAFIPASFRPSRTMAKALSHYASRRRYLGPARRREIALHIAEPLVEQLGLPIDVSDKKDLTSCDLLLCALYVRAFMTEVDDTETAAAVEPPPPPALPAEPQRFQQTPVKPEPEPVAANNGPAVPGSEAFRSRLPKPPTPTP